MRNQERVGGPRSLMVRMAVEKPVWREWAMGKSLAASGCRSMLELVRVKRGATVTAVAVGKSGQREGAAKAGAPSGDSDIPMQ